MSDHPLDEVPDLIFDPRAKPAKAVRFPPNSVFAVDSRPAEIMSPKSNFKVGIVYSPSGEKKPTKEEAVQDPVIVSEPKDTQTDIPVATEKRRPDPAPGLASVDDSCRSFGVNEYGIDDYGMRDQWSKFKMDIANLRNLPRATGRSVFYPSSEVYYQDSFDPFAAYDDSWSRYKGGTQRTVYGTDYANLTQKQLDLLRESIEMEKRRRHDLESKIFEVEAKSRFDMDMAKRVYSRSAFDRATAGRNRLLDQDTVTTIANADTRKLISQFESALDEERAAAKTLKSSIDELKTDLNLSRSIWLTGRVPRRYYVCCSSDYCNCTRKHSSVDWQHRLENHQRALWEKKQEEQRRVASLSVPTFSSFDQSPIVAVKNLNQFNAQLDSMKDELERLKVSTGKGGCAPVDHWCTVPPAVGCTCDPTCCTCWKAQLRHIQSQQWESYSKIRDNTFY